MTALDELLVTPSRSTRVIGGIGTWLARRTSRRGFLMRSAVVGSALAVDTAGFVLRPGTAYASVCGPGASCGSGWTAFCATINHGINACPPGSIAAGWWKADGASLCGGRARYIVDCNATCSRCSTAGRAGICASGCWSCGCHCGPAGQCDQRKVCCNGFRYGQCNQQVRQVGGVMCRVVSCVPPWTYENCTQAAATDNATRDHSSPYLPGAWSNIKARYWQLGENGSVLGASVNAEFAVPGGRAQRYVNGRLSYKPSLGPRYTYGALAARYNALGNEAGILGFPTRDPIAISNARASTFEKGRMSWHPALGAFEVVGPLAVTYNAAGNELGVLKFPTDVPKRTPDGEGRFSTFQRGRISWHPSTGAFWMGVEIAARYVALGAEGGRLGYPLRNELSLTGAKSVGYQGGRIVWVAAAGTFEVYDALDAVYVRAGAEAGALGLPVAQEQAVATGRVQQFEHGRISGGFYVLGPIAATYADNGGELGPLGWPTSDEYSTAPGERRNDFEHGVISYDEASGTTSVYVGS